MANWAERGGLTKAAIGRAARRTRGQFVGATRIVLPFRKLSATRLLFAPHDLRTADPTAAAQMYAGYYAFAGRTLSTRGESVFDAEPPSRAWAEELYGFGWLRHMRAAESAIARDNARSLLDDFAFRRRERSEIAAAPRVAARRLISFIAHSPLLLAGADHVFYDRFVRQIVALTDRLTVTLAGAVDGVDRLQCLIAVTFAAICLDGQDKLLRRFEHPLADELDEQILPDGGHLSRNPAVIIELLLDLLPLRETFAARGMEVPRSVVMAIERMMPHLRLFRHGEGSLALFNGMGLTPPDLMATLAAYSDARARPIEHAAYSGYDRLVQGRSVVVVDSGRAPPGAYATETHAGCLSFEFSHAAARIVVNCGAAYQGPPDLRRASRSTAAHSTLILDDRSSASFVTVQGSERISAGPVDVRVARQQTDAGIEWVASHDGYARALGAVHTRRLTVAAHGEELAGEDEVTLSANRETLSATARFHLHPSVKANLVRDGRSVLLALPGGEIWSFEADGVASAIEESVFFAVAEGARRTDQIVVAFDAVAMPRIAWRFLRIGNRNQAAARDVLAATETHENLSNDRADETAG